MTYAPAPLVELGEYWRKQGGALLGIVGDAAHKQKGGSYHLGKDGLKPGAYSAILPRDVKGLSEAASAIDIGRLDGSLDKLREFSRWFAQQCSDRNPAYSDVREVIFWSVVRNRVVGWSSQAPDEWINDYGDMSHKTHTHISFFRDSEKRPKVPMFAPYFQPAATPPTGEPEMPTLVKYLPGYIAIVKQNGNLRTAPDLKPESLIRPSTGETFPIIGTVKGAVDAGSSEWYVYWSTTTNRYVYFHASSATSVKPALTPDDVAKARAEGAQAAKDAAKAALTQLLKAL